MRSAVALRRVVPRHGQAVCPHGHRKARIVAEYAVLNVRVRKEAGNSFAPLLRMTQLVITAAEVPSFSNRTFSV